MDMGLSERQEMLKNVARDFLTKENPESLVRALEQDEKGYSPELWRKMADRGWMGLIIPQEYGGSGLGPSDLVVLMEEFGRALVMGPYLSSSVMGALPLIEAGSEDQRRQILPRVASGELLLALALTEPSARWDAEGVQMEARREGSEYALSGKKLFVADAQVSDNLVVAARTSRGGAPEDGITLFLLPARSQGIGIQVLNTVAGDKQCEMTLENVKATAASVIGRVDTGWPVIEKTKRIATLATCAYLVGLSQTDFDITLNYAKERTQFGRTDRVVSSDPAQAGRCLGGCGLSAIDHVPGGLERAGGGARRYRFRLHSQGLGLGGLPPGGGPRPADPRRNWIHEGLQDSALLPTPEVAGDDVGRRRPSSGSACPIDGHIVGKVGVTRVR